MGLSCGNPTAFASLQPGEVVVDLGCGGGLDVFLAAAKVGPNGQGHRHRHDARDAGAGRRPTPPRRGADPNVEFHQATIDNLPLADASVDCVISNCVINLAPDKPAVFREIARVLKPGGRLAVSDIALKQPLPAEIGQDLLAYVGCIAGAIRHRRRIGQDCWRRDSPHVEIVDTGADLNAYAKVENQAACCSPESGSCGSDELHEQLVELMSRYDINEYAASVKVFAVKPA